MPGTKPNGTERSGNHLRTGLVYYESVQPNYSIEIRQIPLIKYNICLHIVLLLWNLISKKKNKQPYEKFSKFPQIEVFILPFN